MHIALVSPAWPPGAYPNGIVTYVGWMRQELLAQGHQVSIVALSVEFGFSDPDVHRVADSPSQQIVRSLASRLLNRTRSVFDAAESIAATINRVHAQNPIDVIEMEESFGWVAGVARSCRIPVVCKLHGPAFLTMVEHELCTPFGKEKVRREGEALAQLPVILSPSRCTLSDTLERYTLNPAIAEQIVNPLALHAGARLWERETSDAAMVLFVGRFDKIKGGDLIVRAFRQLLMRKPGSKLVFVGPDSGLVGADGSLVHLREFIATFADSTLVDAISCRGPLPPDEVASLRLSAAVTVVASRRESQGYTALEAMLQACPVVCTDTSGLSEIVEHGVTGLKAKPDNAYDLADQIQRILHDRRLGRSLGLAGREYVLKHHAPSVVVEKTLEVYRRAHSLFRARIDPARTVAAVRR